MNMKAMPALFFSSVIFLIYAEAFTIDVVNITLCKCSDEEIGYLSTNFESEETPDQILNGEFTLPFDLPHDTMIEYESNALHNGQWKFLFKGKRSLCNSIVESVAYEKFIKKVEPEFPEKCEIPAGDYKITDLPISGQYAVLSDVRGVGPIVKHKIKLMVEDDLILCRNVITENQK